MVGLSLEFMDVVDILLCTVLIFYVYKILKGTQAFRIFLGVIFIVSTWLLVTSILQMKLMGSILNQITQFGVITLIVIFQDEIRTFLAKIGSHDGIFSRILHKQESRMESSDVMQIVIACKNMSREKIGALIIIEGTKSLQGIVVTGDEINAKINSRLIENIFFKNSPLHDGAMVINNKCIVAAGCILPVSHSTDIAKSFGLRHRAALGMSEKSDIRAIIVSEETGKISFAENGVLRHDITTKDLEAILSSH